MVYSILAHKLRVERMISVLAVLGGDRGSGQIGQINTEITSSGGGERKEGRKEGESLTLYTAF